MTNIGEIPCISEKTSESFLPDPSSQSQQQARVARWLSDHYKITHAKIESYVSIAYKNAEATKLDPLLILAVMSIESSLNDKAQSSVGAQGLMQVLPHFHRDKFKDVGGVKTALDPIANIHVGSRVLKEYIVRDGSIEGGLKRYVGAAYLSSDGGYSKKVLTKYTLLQDVALGKYKVPVS